MADVLTKHEWIKTVPVIRSTDADYAAYVESMRASPLLIELSVTNVNERGIFLTARDYLTSEVIETGLTFDEAYAREDWKIVSNYWPRASTIPTVSFDNPREYTDRLMKMRAELGNLREEENTTTDTARYKLLSSPTGPIRELEYKIDTLKMLVSVSMHATFGFWPSAVREVLGI